VGPPVHPPDESAGDDWLGEERRGSAAPDSALPEMGWSTA